MRVLRSSVLLCLFFVAVTPAPAFAWFEWLDRLSGPGSWYGVIVDVRVKCFGEAIPTGKLDGGATGMQLFESVMNDPSEQRDLLADLAQLKKVARSLNVAGVDRLEDIESRLNAALVQAKLGARRSVQAEGGSPAPDPQKVAVDLLDSAREVLADVKRASVSLGMGILVDLCPSDGKLRAFAFHVGYDWMFTEGEPKYANSERIGMHTLTVGVSYRIPLSMQRDIVDVGTNVGIYRFRSDGFDSFSGWTIEPFVDLHMPTSFRTDEKRRVRRFLGRFSLRAGLTFFPGGFKAEDFQAQPGVADISGREASASATVYFRLCN